MRRGLFLLRQLAGYYPRREPAGDPGKFFRRLPYLNRARSRRAANRCRSWSGYTAVVTPHWRGEFAALYDGQALAKRGAIGDLVNCLAISGLFFAHPALEGEGGVYS